MRHSSRAKTKATKLWDTLIDATGVRYGHTIATRNKTDFHHSSTFDPWHAIVMIENIVRYLEAGEKPLQAALKGALSAMLGLLESFVKGLRSGKQNWTQQAIIKNLPSPSALSLEFACIPDLSNRDLGMGSTPKFSRNRERKPGTAGSVRQLIARYPGEWLAIELKAEEEGRPKAGRVVCHAKDRDAVWRKTKSRRRLYIVYAGPPLQEGYAAAF